MNPWAKGQAEKECREDTSVSCEEKNRPEFLGRGQELSARQFLLSRQSARFVSPAQESAFRKKSFKPERQRFSSSHQRERTSIHQQQSPSAHQQERTPIHQQERALRRERRFCIGEGADSALAHSMQRRPDKTVRTARKNQRSDKRVAEPYSRVSVQSSGRVPSGRKQFILKRRFLAQVGILALVLAVLFSGLFFLLGRNKIEIIDRSAPEKASVSPSGASELFSVATDFRKQQDVVAFLQSHPLVQKTEDLLLVNRRHPLSASFQPNLVEYGRTGMKLQVSLVRPLDELADAVYFQTGEQLRLESAYRSFAEQQKVKQLNPEVAADPGTSEHESGLAIDLSVPSGGHYAFAHTSAGIFVAENAWKYGFIVRYPEDKTEQTGIPFEPWHLRYVGKIHAAIMHKKNWCLEEYIAALNEHDFFTAGDYRIYRRSAVEADLPSKWDELTVSPDNTGAYIFTYKIKEE